MVAAWNRLLAACLVWPTEAYAVNLVCAFSTHSRVQYLACLSLQRSRSREFARIFASTQIIKSKCCFRCPSNAKQCHQLSWLYQNIPPKSELLSLIRSQVCSRLRNWWHAWLVIFEDVDWVYHNQLYAPNFPNRVPISGGLPLCIVESKGSFRQWTRRQQEVTVIKVLK